MTIFHVLKYPIEEIVNWSQGMDGYYTLPKEIQDQYWYYYLRHQLSSPIEKQTILRKLLSEYEGPL